MLLLFVTKKSLFTFLPQNLQKRGESETQPSSLDDVSRVVPEKSNVQALLANPAINQGFWTDVILTFALFDLSTDQQD